MKHGPPGSFGAQLKALREAAGYTQEELATIAGLSVHGVSALERGGRRRPHVDTVRALTAALDLTGAARDALVRSARAPAASAAADELVAFPLPLPLTALLGRDADVQTLREWLADPAIRLITITGPGGAGKTRLALEIAHAVAAERTVRVVFVPLATVRNPALVASSIGEALGLSDETAGDLPKRARVACEGQPTLLLIDNFEHLLEAAPLIADLLSSAASLRVLATSRAGLHVRGEREYVLGPLPLELDADAIAVSDLARSPAVRLFVERVREVQPHFRLTAANAATVVAICRRLDALPLALELAAPWMKVLTADNLLRRLGNDTLDAAGVARDLPARQQTMSATVAWSYQLLAPDEQRAFRRFGVLPGPFAIDAAASVLAGRDALHDESEALRATARLIDKSLLGRVNTSAVPTCPVYQMLETVRAYAVLELNASGERDEALEGMVRYCVSEARLSRDGLIGPAQFEWLNRVREDLENYRSAFTWLIECGRVAEASEIAWSLKYFWLIRGHPAEGLTWYEKILSQPSLSSAVELRTLAGAAVLWYTQGSLGTARAALNRASALAHDAGDADVVAHIAHLFGHVEHAAGNVDAAREKFSQSIAAFRELAVPSGVGSALSGLAVLELASGKMDEAEQLLDEATGVLRNAGPWFLTWALYARAILAIRRRDPDTAIAFARESLTRIRESHDKFAFVYALVPLAAAAALKGEDAWAARIFGARDAITDRTGVTVVDKSVQDLRDEPLRVVRARLGPARWEYAYAAGRKSSVDALLRDVDEASAPERRPKKKVARRAAES